MKFKIGDATDTALCVVLKHEFLRCDEAYNDFVSSATNMIVGGENRRIAYQTYNAYARFIHHLYEFMMGAVMRDRQNTESLKADLADRYIAGHTQRILTNRRRAIVTGTAPDWERIGYYPEKVPETFAEDFRHYRNTVIGHVKYERSNLSMTEFYTQSYKYLFMLYREAKSWWGRQSDEFPNLQEITSFSVYLKGDPPLHR
jgi:hypothetical protein